MATVAVGTFVSVLDQTGVSLALPELAIHFGATIPAVQWVALGFILVTGFPTDADGPPLGPHRAKAGVCHRVHHIHPRSATIRVFALPQRGHSVSHISGCGSRDDPGHWHGYRHFKFPRESDARHFSDFRIAFSGA